MTPTSKVRRLQHFLVSIVTSYCSRNTLNVFVPYSVPALGQAVRTQSGKKEGV